MIFRIAQRNSADYRKFKNKTLLQTGFLFLCLSVAIPIQNAEAFSLRDISEIGAAYMTHLVMHEVGHGVVATEVGAAGHKLSFFTQKNGRFYPGLSTYESIPEKSKLPYAIGGEKMASIMFEYGFQSYRKKPTTYNEALMFFSTFDFFTYTLLANYVHPDNRMYDPTIIREETGLSREQLLSIVLAKTLLNTYRVFNKDFPLIPMIKTTRKSVALLLRYNF